MKILQITTPYSTREHSVSQPIYVGVRTCPIFETTFKPRRWRSPLLGSHRLNDVYRLELGGEIMMHEK